MNLCDFSEPSDPPSAVQASPVNSNTVEVSWEPPARPNGIITRYTVMYQRDPGVPEESWECEQKDGESHFTCYINPFRTKTPKYLFFRGKHLYFIIKLATQISLVSLQISKT